jgi:hypothetical protein
MKGRRVTAQEEAAIKHQSNSLRYSCFARIDRINLEELGRLRWLKTLKPEGLDEISWRNLLCVGENIHR